MLHGICSGKLVENSREVNVPSMDPVIGRTPLAKRSGLLNTPAPGRKNKKMAGQSLTRPTSTSSSPLPHQGSVESIPGEFAKFILFGAVVVAYQSTLYCHGTVLP